MADIRPGDIWIADFGRIADAQGAEMMKVRPALIVSPVRNRGSDSQFVMVVPFTSNDLDVPGHLTVEEGVVGLDHASYLACEDVRTLSVDLIDRERGKVGEVEQRILDRVDRCIEGQLD